MLLAWGGEKGGLFDYRPAGYDGTAAAEAGAAQITIAAADVGWSEVVEYGGNRAEI